MRSLEFFLSGGNTSFIGDFVGLNKWLKLVITIYLEKLCFDKFNTKKFHTFSMRSDCLKKRKKGPENKEILYLSVFSDIKILFTDEREGRI